MEVFEQMQRFKFSSPYSHSGYIVRCWLPLKDENDRRIIGNMQFYDEIKNLTKDDEVYPSDCIKIAKGLAIKFNMNACEVINESDGDGAVYYREWP